LDVRVDKKWMNRKKTKTRTFYLDIQNAFNATQNTPLTILDRPLDTNKKPIGAAVVLRNASGIAYFKTKTIQYKSGSIIPCAGLQIEF
jgi:hypothetical protein